MVHVIITHEVKDFSEWKKGFDNDETGREQAGVRINNIYTSVENQNLVTIISEFPSVEVVEVFLYNPVMQETMRNSGVIGILEVKILNKVH